MRISFSQYAVHHVHGPLPTEFSIVLHKAILTHSGWNYACLKNDDGYFLKPVFHDSPYRNSFVPEITLFLSQQDDVTTLEFKGQPVKVVRLFMLAWFGGLFLFQLLLLLVLIFFGADEVFPMFIPSIMCAFGYLLCYCSTKVTFRSVVAAITKAFP